MQDATPETVLGDFADVELSVGGVPWRFFRRGDAFVVATPGEDGADAELRVTHTFGVEPLQQYLVDGPRGRRQALTVAWDTRPAEDGGQRWFSLTGDAPVAPDDVLHWSGVGNNWNLRCGECHSTDFRKGYDLETDTYTSTWAEVDVACEACHGAGSRHVEWARARERGEANGGDTGLIVDLRSDGAQWVLDPETGIARRSKLRVPPGERDLALDVCARCHARRSTAREAAVGTPFLDTHRPALLEEGLYFADGQIDDEVYVWGSFVQSRMYAAGVACRDCHDPHSLAVRGGLDAVCAQCHAPERFAAASHHHHGEGSEGASCVGCHMPARTYMEVDPRRDHGFRVPRPDLSDALGTPNACNGCHEDRDAAWATQAIVGWYGTERLDAPHPARAIAAGRRGAVGAARELASLAEAPREPAIVRATALVLAARTPDPGLAPLVARTSRDPDPLVRWAAARAGESLPPRERAARLAPLLGDPRALVRREAGRALAGEASAALAPSERHQQRRAVEAYRAEQTYAADDPGAHVNLGLLALAEGRAEDAAAHYRTALDVGDHFLPAYVNLADLYRAQGRDAEGEPLLRRALAIAPEDPEVHHALGLLLVRVGRRDEALTHLERAATLAPESARLVYVHGVARLSTGDSDGARDVLTAGHERHPADRSILEALATLHRDRGETAQALDYARRLEALFPTDPSVRALRQDLESNAR